MQFRPCGVECIMAQANHLRVERSEKINPAVLLQVFCQHFERQFVADFVFSIVCAAFLDCVIGEMDISTIVPHIEGLAGSPHIPFLVPVHIEEVIYYCSECIASHIELTPPVQQGHNIFLHDRARFTRYQFIYNLFYSLQLTFYSDSVPSVRVFTRLYDPRVFAFLVLCNKGLPLPVVRHTFYMKSEGKVRKWVFLSCLVVVLEIQEEIFLIADLLMMQ